MQVHVLVTTLTDLDCDNMNINCTDAGFNSHVRHGFTMIPGLLHPKSIGAVYLKCVFLVAVCSAF